MKPPAPRPAARRLRRFGGAWRGPHPATRCGFTPQYEGRNKDGNVVKRFPPTTTPEEIDAEIAKLL